MIGYNLEGFANSMANLEHVALYFDNLVDKDRTLSMIFHGIFLLIVNTCEHPSGRVMVSLSWNLYVQRKNKRVYDAQTRKNANPDCY